MEKEKGKEPEALPDEKLDEAAGGTVTFGGQLTGAASFPGFGGAKTGITDGTSKSGYLGGVTVASGDVNNDGIDATKLGDGSVKPGG